MSFLDRERADFPARSASSYSLGVLFLFLLMVCGSVAHAQSAALGGVVMDPSSAMVRDAQVTVTNQRTSVALHTKTNGSGLYSVPFIQPGLYTLAVEAPGFKRYERTGITIETAQTVAIDVRLQIGETSQSVTVNGSGNYINTTDASVSTVVDRQFVENIPLNGRSFQSLETGVPGVSVVPSGGTGYSGELSVNGQRTEENYYTVDGVSATTGVNDRGPGYSAGYSGSVPGQSVLGTTQSLVSIDDLQEFRATTSTYSAEYGRTPGGQFTFTTRSGTNDLHGSLYDYLRNDAFDANNYFNKYLTPYTPRQPEKQNDFGGTLGGPITIPHLYDGKDKTFFFLSYEGLLLRQGLAAKQYEVPSVALRQATPLALQPYVNSFPLPNGGPAVDNLDFFNSGFEVPSSLHSGSVRVDHNFSDKFKVFARYGYSISATTTVLNDLANPESVNNRIQTLTLGSTNIFGAHATNDVRFNLTNNALAQQYSITNFGGASPFSITGTPGLNSSDWLLFSFGYGLAPYLELVPDNNHQRQWNVTDTFAKIIGSHSFKFGMDYRRIQTNETLPHSYELVGYFDSASIIANQPGYLLNYYTGPGSMNPIYTNFSAFAQDEWRVTPRLSLSLGVRWELAPPPHDANGNDPYTITSTDFATLSVAPKGTPLWRTRYANFDPRIGVAYQIHQQPGHETVLRAGAGMFYDTANTQASTGYMYNVGVTSLTSYASVPFPLTAQQIQSAPAPSLTAPYNSEVFGFDPNLRLPYTWQWNVSLEQAFGQNQSLTLSYVGSAGRNLLIQKEYDPTLSGNPNFVSIANGGDGLYLTTNNASSDYNSLQIQFQRKLSHGLQAMFAYTWSHAFDDASTNFQVLTEERAASDYDIRNNFQAALTYSIPGTYSNRVASAVFTQWALDARVSARSALPIDIFSDTYVVNSAGTTLSYHPNRVPTQPLYVNVAGAPGGRVLNYAAFTTATDANGNETEGDFPRNGARGFDAIQADITAHRDFQFTERVDLQFRAEAFNILNHSVFGNVYNLLSYGQGLFGYAYQTENESLGGLSPLYQVGGPRSLQLALRLHF